MIDRFLRRLTVRQRILGGFVILLLLFAVSIPVVVLDRLTLIGWVQQITEVEARVDRLVLLASTRITSSRVNLMRYADNYTPSAQEALTDVDRANQLLTEARDITTSPAQQADVNAVLERLVEYKKLISDVQAARTEERLEDVSQLLFQAYRLEGEIWQRIERIVSDSEIRVTAINETIYTEARTRLVVAVVGYTGMLVLALLLAGLVQRSITRPVAELRSGAEAFRLGQLDSTIPVVGADELSLLARAFNQMATQLRDLIDTLEQRVAQRTQELEQRSGYLQAAAEVSHAATSILDMDQLTQQVVELIRERFGLYYVGLFLLGEASEWAILRAGTGEAGQAMLARGHRIRVGEGMIGWSIANARSRIALDVGEDAVRLASAELPNTRSEAALPLRSRDQVLGALTVQSDQPSAFDEASIVVLQTMADQVAVALDNAHLFAESQEALTTMRQAYGEITHQAWTQIIRARPEMGYLCDAEGVHQIATQWRPEMLQASQEDRIVRSDGTMLFIPIRIHGHVIGAVRLCKPDDDGEWTADEISLMETLADQLSLALDSARLHQDTQRRAARERLLGEVTARMRETLDVDAVLRAAAQEMRRALGLHDVTIQLGQTGEGSQHQRREEGHA